jgi:CRP/FNR family cyclic AMP-dependent transcriptional regulator
MADLYFLIEFPIFRDFDGDDIDALAKACEVLDLPTGAQVVKEGDPGDALFIVQTGVLEVSRQIEGKTLHINLLSAGEFFGEMALIDGTPRSADITVKEAVQLVRLPVSAYGQLKKDAPATALKVADVLLKTLSFRLRRSTTRALASEAAPAAAQKKKKRAAKKKAPRRAAPKKKSKKKRAR